MCEVIECETDSEFLCFPFNDNPYEDNYPNNIPQTNFKLKWLDNKEDMLKLLDYMNNSDNLKGAEEYEFLYEYVSEDYFVYEECFLDEIKTYLSDFCIMRLLHDEGKYDKKTFIIKLFALFSRQNIFVKRFLCENKKLSVNNSVDLTCKILYTIHRVSKNVTNEKNDAVIKDFIYEKLYEEVDNYYGYDNEEIPKGEIN